MANKKMLLFLMAGLLAMSFTVPATAADRPSYAMNPDDVPGWWIYSENSLFDWSTLNLGGYNVTLSAWYQIWINNNTPQATEELAWQNATAGMLLLVVDVGQPVDNWCIQIGPLKFCFNLWNILTATPWTWFNNSAEEKTISGLTKAFIWKSSVSSTWWGLGYHGDYLIFALGKGDQTPPGNPFEGGILAAPVKLAGPQASGASQANIMTIMATQAGAFGGGIPGFTVAPIFITIAVLLTIIYLLRKDQLHLLK
jgi:hypothetical protein